MRERERERERFLKFLLSDCPHKCKSVVRRIPTGVTKTECVSHRCDYDRTRVTQVRWRQNAYHTGTTKTQQLDFFGH